MSQEEEPTRSEIAKRLDEIESKLDRLQEDVSLVANRAAKSLARESQLRRVLRRMLARVAPEQTEDLRSDLESGHKSVEEALERLLAQAHPDRFGHLSSDERRSGAETSEGKGGDESENER